MSKMRGEDAERRRVELCMEHVMEELGMDWIDVRLTWATERDGDRVACETLPDWEYRQASLKWNLSVTIAMSDLELLRTAVHECVHVLVASMESQVPDGEIRQRACEFAVENVARAIMGVMKDEA